MIDQSMAGFTVLVMARIYSEWSIPERFTMWWIGRLERADLPGRRRPATLHGDALMTVAWIAERLRMGSVANVNTLCITGGKVNESSHS